MGCLTCLMPFPGSEPVRERFSMVYWGLDRRCLGFCLFQHASVQEVAGWNPGVAEFCSFL